MSQNQTNSSSAECFFKEKKPHYSHKNLSSSLVVSTPFNVNLATMMFYCVASSNNETENSFV